MATKEAYNRLKKEVASLKKNPPPYIDAAPLDSNILEWHYVVLGPPGTPYEGGLYHGKLKFPPEYPFKPPSIYMITPSGRFSTNTRLCLSISDFHPQSWKPVWSVASILTGLLSFMLEDTPTTGSVESTTAEKKLLAEKSWQTNLKDPIFREVFPELCEEMKVGKVLSLVPKTTADEQPKPVCNPSLLKNSKAVLPEITPLEPNPGKIEKEPKEKEEAQGRGTEKELNQPAGKKADQAGRVGQAPSNHSPAGDLAKILVFFVSLYLLYRLVFTFLGSEAGEL